MSKKKSNRIVVLDLSSEFGGHQAMSINLLTTLKKAYPGIEVTLVHSGSFRNKSTQMIADRIIDSDVIIPSFSRPGIFSLFSDTFKVFSVAKQIKNINADLMISIPGGLEGTTIPILIASALRMRMGTYVPMIHSLSLQNAKLWKLRDLIAWHILRLSDSTAVITASQLTQLERQNVPNTFLIPNPALFPKSNRQKPSSTKTIVGLVGRLEPLQKGHDLYLNFIDSFSNKLNKYKFLIIGDGIGYGSLKKQIVERKIDVELVSWTDQWPNLVDIVLMPSRFEGVPLIMLEALSYGMPVISTPVGGIIDFLPINWIFNLNSYDSWMLALDAASQVDSETTALSLHKRIVAEYSSENFNSRVKIWIDHLLKPQ